MSWVYPRHEYAVSEAPYRASYSIVAPTTTTNPIPAKHNINPYVESSFDSPSVPTTPAQNFHPNHQWPTPSTEPWLNSAHTQRHSSRTSPVKRPPDQTHSRLAQGLGLFIQTGTPQQAGPSSATAVRSRQHQPQSTPIEPARRVLSSPGSFQTPYAVTSAGRRQLPGPSIYTPPLSAEPLRTADHHLRPETALTMAQQRRMSSQGQRPLMGPPETPSRNMIPQSPSLFPDIQFSPDMFSQHVIDPHSAPIYPQSRLFWDPTVTTTPLQTTPQQYHTPGAYPDDFSASFNSNSTIMPQHFIEAQQDMPYDLPSVSQPMPTSFMDGSIFPAPFQTSPRVVPPQPDDNPTQFLSSPARRFGGEPKADNLSARRAVPDLPAYHHQMQELRREKEIFARERRKPRTMKTSQDEDIVMRSVHRALSPPKRRQSARPAIARSNTLSGVQELVRRSSTTFDTVSIDSGNSSRSIRNGRSSPLRQVRDFTRRSSACASLRRSRSSVSLAIDDNGVARTIMNALPEDADEEMNDSDMTDQLSSEDENDQQMLYSFAEEPQNFNDSFLSRADARDEIRSSAYLNMGSDRIARISRVGGSTLDPRLTGPDPATNPTSTIRRARGETLTSTNTDTTNGGNAQQALRAIKQNQLQDRSRSASSHASSSSMQFHSSPPMQQGHLAGYNHSPTTITDPELTPSTDADSLGSSSATRCVCNSASPDGNIMIQCDSCSKWLHAKCIGLNNRNIPEVYVCAFCEKTPMRGSTIRGGGGGGSTLRQRSFHQSPLAHKSNRLWK